jgi:hypothetical protein
MSGIFGFTFSTRKRNKPECVLTPKTLHDTQTIFRLSLKKVASFVPRNQALLVSMA